MEIASLDQAEIYVNQVMARAANADGWVKNADYTLAANYFVKVYPPGYFTSKGQDDARILVQFERKLELAMEEHRF